MLTTKHKRGKGRLLVVDGMNLMHRGHWSMATLSTSSVMKDGEEFPTGALKGFFGILCADIDELDITQVVVVFDAGGKTWRHKLLPEYKSNRTKNEETQKIVDQVPWAVKILKSLGVPVFRKKGVEGDDIVGCFMKQMSDEFEMIYVSSTDKDFSRYVRKNVKLVKNKGEVWGKKEIIARYGVPPKQMVDFLALIGDGVDYIHGVHKCGKVTAAKLLTKYGDIETIWENRKDLTKGLRANVEKVGLKRLLLNRKLIRLKTDMFEVTPEDTLQREPDEDAFNKLCKQLEMKVTKTKLKKVFL